MKGQITMNNSIKRFIGYLVYVVALGYVVIIADNFERYLKKLYQSTYDLTGLWLFLSISPILFGFTPFN